MADKQQEITKMNNSFEQAAENLLDAFLHMDYNKDTIIDSQELKPLH